MKTKSEFLQYYNEVLSGKMEEVETFRLEYCKKKSGIYVKLILVETGILPFLFLGIYLDQTFLTLFIVPVAMLIAAAVGSTYLQQNFDDFRLKFKNTLISYLVRFFGHGFVYNPQKGITHMAVLISRMPKVADGFTGQDYLEGQMGETFIQLSKGVSDHFNGIFIIASFNKYFKGEYLVFSKHPFQKITREWNEQRTGTLSNEPLSNLTLEDPKFNKGFDVFCSDAVESRYILTPSLMNRMIDFKSKVKDVNFSFARSKFFIAIETPDNYMFEPRYNSPITKEHIMNWYSYLNAAFDIVEEFNLNTRIWSKP